MILKGHIAGITNMHGLHTEMHISEIDPSDMVNLSVDYTCKISVSIFSSAG